MKVNSRRVLPFLRAALPRDCKLFGANIGDFAVCRAGSPHSAIAFLSAIRPSHRSLRIDGVVGRASLPDALDRIEKKTPLPTVRFTHLLNVDELREACFLDDEHLEEGTENFLAALAEVFERLHAGEELLGMDRMPFRSDIFIRPLRVADAP